MSRPDSPNRRKLLAAQALLDQGQLAAAKALLEQACKADRGDADAWYGLGLVNGMLGDFRHCQGLL